MKTDRKEARCREIYDATYEVLAEKGYKGTSILAVAKAAKASNETLYNWFGNKQGLIAAMVEENAKSASEFLDAALAEEADLNTTLRTLGPHLLRLITSERAIALNRAAAADVADGGKLGQTIAEHGRDLIAGKLKKLFLARVKSGEMTKQQAQNAAEIYLGQLIGDVQIRRVIGVQGLLGETEIKRRVNGALDALSAIAA